MNADRPHDPAMMEAALGEARASLEAGGVPVGAALADGGRLVASGHNERVQREIGRASCRERVFRTV